MNCYLCEDVPGPGGTRLRSMSAAGICKCCGVGLCRRHGYRSPHADFALLCPKCRERAERNTLESARMEAATR